MVSHTASLLLFARHKRWRAAKEKERRLYTMRMKLFQLKRLQCLSIMHNTTTQAARVIAGSIRTRVKVHSAALPHPSKASIMKLLHCNDDPSWIALCGFSRPVFEEMYTQFAPVFVDMWKRTHHTPLILSRGGRPGTIFNRSNGDCRRVLMLVLFFLTTSTPQKVLCVVFGLSPSTLSRYLILGLRAFNATLKLLPDARVEWPNGDQQQYYNGLIANRYPGLSFRPFAFMDGLNLPVLESGDFFEQNAHYNAWLAGTFISNLFIYAPDGTVIYCRINLPGSYHDAWLANPLRELILNREGFLRDGYSIVADTAFPRKDAMAGKIITPLKQDEADRLSKTKSRDELIALHRNHMQTVSIRQAAEWGMRQVQCCFARLKLPLPLDKHLRLLILETVVLAHNYRVRKVGLSQIRTVYSPLWNGLPFVRPATPKRYHTPHIVF